MDTRNRAAPLGSGEETRGAETVRSLSKDALGRLSNYNGSCASQQVPTRLLLLASGLHGPVECAGLLLHLNRGHGITASLPDVMSELPQELHYVAADFALGDGRPLLALQSAPLNTWVLSKWPMDTSLEDLSYLHEMPMRLLHLASGPHGPVECARLLLHLERGHGITASLTDAMGELTKELHYVAGDCTLGDGRHLLAPHVSTRVHIKWPTETSVEDLLCYLHFGDLNLTETRGEDVNEVYAIESTPPICFLIHTPRTQEQRTVWLLLNNNTRIFQGDTSGTMHMEAFQNMCTQIIPCDSSSLQKYQATNKESGHWLLKDELDAFNTSYVCYIGPDASAGVVSCNFATHVTKIKRECVVKQGSLLDAWDQLSHEPCYMVADFTLGDVRLLLSLEIAPVSTRVPIKWPMDTVVEDLLTYPHDPKAASFLSDKTIATGKVYYGNVSTKYSSTHHPSERVASLCKIQLSHRFLVTSWRKHNLGWRSLSRLLKVAKGSGEETRGAETVRNFRKDALGRPCNCNGSCASQEVPPRLLHLASGPHGLVECSRLLLHLKGGHRLFNFGDMNTAEWWGNDDVNEIYALESRALIGLLIHTPSTQEQRTMWLLLNNNTRIFQGNTSGIMHMEAFQDMCLNLNSTNIIPCDRISLQKNQAMNKGSGVWLVKDELDYFNGSHRPDASAGVVSCNFATQLPKIKCQCALKQGSKFVPQAREVDVVVSAKDHMAGKTEHVMDTVPEEFLPAQLHKTASHCILDGKLSKQHTLRKWCLLLLQCLPSWFFITRKWFLGFSVVESKQLRYRYPLTSSLKGGAPATFIMELAHEVHEYNNSRGSIQFLLGISTTYVVPGGNGQATRMVHMPLLSQPNTELAESELGSQPPIFPLTTNIIVDSHDAERQHIDPCSKSNVQSQQLTPIFVRHVSGELVFSVNLEQSSDHLMQLYAHKTKTKLECQYFVYGRKILEPHGSLMFYGVERDTTIHVCTRLLGGLTTISQFIIKHEEELVTEVTLPNGLVSLKMTKAGCLFLSTWLKCFTRAFADSKTWNGEFTLDDFRVLNGHVLVLNSAEKRLDSRSMHADLKKLVTHIKTIFYKNKSYLVSKFAPYLENLINFLLKLKYPALLDEDRLFIETHICCVESAARGILLVMLRKKQKSLNELEQHKWERATELPDDQQMDYVNFINLSNTPVFDDIIAHAKGRKEAYGKSRHSTFRLMRDEFMHGPSKRFDKTYKPWTEKFKNDDGIELMIPAYNPNLVPDIIYSWINDQSIDIKPELLAAQVRCTCVICHPAHSGHKGGGESSKAGKGKQPESPGSSQPSTPSSRQGSNVGAATAPPSAWQQPQAAASLLFSQPSTTSSRPGSNLGPVRPQWQQSHAALSSGFPQPSTTSSRPGSNLGPVRHPLWQQSHAAASSGFSQPSTPSSRQGFYPGAGRPPPPWQQSQAAARSGFSQPAAARPRPPPPAPTQQESSSSEFEWQTAKRKGKGKRYD